MTPDHNQVAPIRLKHEDNLQKRGGYIKESERGQVAPCYERAERLLLIGQCSVNGNSLRGLKKKKRKREREKKPARPVFALLAPLLTPVSLVDPLTAFLPKVTLC